MLRWLLLAVLAALAAVQAVRVAMVRDVPRQAGARLWPDHPRVLVRRAMAQVGESAARQQPLPQAAINSVAELARRAPLAPEPFLIHGALAQMDGDAARAERLFIAARARDPRSEAARYFLAERFLTTGRTAAALAEMSVLSRLVPGATEQFAPALAGFARTAAGVPELKGFLKRSPEFEPAVLQELAKDARNAELVLSLWSGRPATGTATGAAPAWQATLLKGLVEARQYGRARNAWSRFAGAEARPGIYNPQFRRDPAPPPFNWSVPNAGGVVEPAAGGGVQIIYFGRQDVVLAEQLLVLAPGRYELVANVRGGSGARGSVVLSVRCDRGQQLAALPLGGAATARLAGRFEVPAGCPAQWLQLAGTAGEFARSAEFTMSGLELRRGGRQ